ncbi:MAG TPA: homoserine kinase, partial [Blastocatellia bacterium]|nr:homoserine kinase [Blastocatellia bacterium]
VHIVIPASTSNLGASFATCGLALSLYLRVSVEPHNGGFAIVPSGEGADRVPRDESNLICRVARFVADDRRRELEGARLLVNNEIPLARGLGSSSSAIIGGISVYETISGDRLTTEQILRYALHFEDHGDNLAPSLLGGLVVACVVESEQGRSLKTIKRVWPERVKMVLAIPDYEMDTREMREALPARVALSDAVFNIQRAALLQAAISEQRFDLFSEALRDRLHQSHRTPHGPGLSEVLRMNEETDKHPGLLGVAMSGAGSTMIAFATENLAEIATVMSARFGTVGVGSRTIEADVNNEGRTTREGL